MRPDELVRLYLRTDQIFYPSKERGMAIKHRATDPDAPKEAVPCPFMECSGKPAKLRLLVIETDRTPDKGKTWIYCANCGGSGPHADGAEEAVDRWNRRNIAPQLLERRKP